MCERAQQHAGAPFVGDVHGAGVQEDGLGCLAGNLLGAGVLQEVADYPPEQGALRVALLEVECSRAWSRSRHKKTLGVPVVDNIQHALTTAQGGCIDIEAGAHGATWSSQTIRNNRKVCPAGLPSC